VAKVQFKVVNNYQKALTLLNKKDCGFMIDDL